MAVTNKVLDKIKELTAYIQTGTKTAKSLKKLKKLVLEVPIAIFYDLGTFFVVKDWENSTEEKVRKRASSFLQICREKRGCDSNNTSAGEIIQRDTSLEVSKQEHGHGFKSPGLSFIPTPPPTPTPQKIISQSPLRRSPVKPTLPETPTSSMRQREDSWKQESVEMNGKKVNQTLQSALSDNKSGELTSMNSRSLFSNKATPIVQPPQTANQLLKRRSPTGGLELDEGMVKPRKQMMKVYSGTKQPAVLFDPLYKKVCSNHSFPHDVPFNVVHPYLHELTVKELTDFLVRNPQFVTKADHLFEKFVKEEFRCKPCNQTWQSRYEWQENEIKRLAEERIRNSVNRVKSKTAASLNKAKMIDLPTMKTVGKSTGVNTSSVRKVLPLHKPQSPGNLLTTGPKSRCRGNPIRSVASTKKKETPLFKICKRQQKQICSKFRS